MLGTLAAIAGCSLFPLDNAWNQRVDKLPIASGSAAIVHTMAIPNLHPDFGTADGIPFNVVTSVVPDRSVRFDYADESDPGPYPIPAHPLQEQGSDGHVLIVNRETCRLYELFDARVDVSGAWSAGSGAVWDLSSNAVRPAGWTSADAAGLPILPGLARYDEVAAGEINHALRVTLSRTQAAYLFPARHLASSVRDPAVAPMGLRLRLKAGFPIASFPLQARVVLHALQRYGLIVADNGSSGYITGAPSPSWNDDALHALQLVPGTALEVVDTTTLTTTLTATPPARLWNTSVRIARGRALARGFLTADSLVALEAARRGVVIRRVLVRCRQGLVSVSLHAVAGARYRLTVR